MMYVDYIRQDHARRERAEQLANAYNQKPEGQRVQNLWMHSIEKKQNYRLDATAFICISIVIAIILFAALICIGYSLPVDHVH